MIRIHTYAVAARTHRPGALAGHEQELVDAVNRQDGFDSAELIYDLLGSESLGYSPDPESAQRFIIRFRAVHGPSRSRGSQRLNALLEDAVAEAGLGGKVNLIVVGDDDAMLETTIDWSTERLQSTLPRHAGSEPHFVGAWG